MIDCVCIYIYIIYIMDDTLSMILTCSYVTKNQFIRSQVGFMRAFCARDTDKEPKPPGGL